MLKDDGLSSVPGVWAQISAVSSALGFSMPSDARTGALLKVLAASKPGGRMLELGTGTGLATACFLAGMDSSSRLISVDNDIECQRVAQDVLGSDTRLSLVLADGLEFLRSQPAASFDLVFADAWPGKYEGIDDALRLVKPGGIYIGDDMLPQANWPDNHQERADDLISYLEGLVGWATVSLCWGSGFVIAARAG